MARSGSAPQTRNEMPWSRSVIFGHGLFVGPVRSLLLIFLSPRPRIAFMSAAFCQKNTTGQALIAASLLAVATTRSGVTRLKNVDWNILVFLVNNLTQLQRPQIAAIYLGIMLAVALVAFPLFWWRQKVFDDDIPGGPFPLPHPLHPKSAG